MLTDVLKFNFNFKKRKNYINSEINMLISAGHECVIIYNAIFTCVCEQWAKN